MANCLLGKGFCCSCTKRCTKGVFLQETRGGKNEKNYNHYSAFSCMFGSGFCIHWWGYSNQQRIIAVDSPVYKAMENLYIMVGKALPSSSGPWSENEMALMLSRIDRKSLNDTGKNTTIT